MYCITSYRPSCRADHCQRYHIPTTTTTTITITTTTITTTHTTTRYWLYSCTCGHPDIRQDRDGCRGLGKGGLRARRCACRPRGDGGGSCGSNGRGTPPGHRPSLNQPHPSSGTGLSLLTTTLPPRTTATPVGSTIPGSCGPVRAPSCQPTGRRPSSLIGGAASSSRGQTHGAPGHGRWRPRRGTRARAPRQATSTCP